MAEARNTAPLVYPATLLYGHPGGMYAEEDIYYTRCVRMVLPVSWGKSRVLKGTVS